MDWSLALGVGVLLMLDLGNTAAWCGRTLVLLRLGSAVANTASLAAGHVLMVYDEAIRPLLQLHELAIPLAQ